MSIVIFRFENIGNKFKIFCFFKFQVELPFLTLLISGGHCLLALAKSVDKFYILGESMDTSPGVLFDKIARRLKLSYLKRFRNFHGGVLIEKASREGNPEAFSYGFQLSDYKDCNFALSGLAGKTNTIIKAEEKKYGKLLVNVKFFWV